MANRAAARDRAKRADRQEAARRAGERTQRRRRLIAIVAVVVALLFVVGFVLAAANSDSGNSTATSTGPTTPDQSSTSVTDGPTISVPPGQGGAAITGPTPCPAENGSSPRTTSFAQPPPTCIDLTKTYDAIMDTSQGTLTFLLQSKLAPRSVNNFVVLARYHYWDGTPVTNITTDTTMQAGLVVNPDGKIGPGYTLPAEYQKSGKTVGVIIVPGTLAMAPENDAGAIGGQFLLALGEKATDLPPTTTVIGLMLNDPSNALHKIDQLGTQAGGPTQPVTIRSVRIVPAPVSS